MWNREAMIEKGRSLEPELKEETVEKLKAVGGVFRVRVIR